jgi:leucyl-tRNA synthetase
LEKKYQMKWQEERLFEVSAPSPDELKGLSPAEVREKYPKWFGNFPYPYMNGSLHLGHAFTISKVEFAAGYQRLLGKRVLFPHGLHATGMPIKVSNLRLLAGVDLISCCVQAAADKIVREMEMFGPDLENFDEEDKPAKAMQNGPAPTAAVGKATKGKIAAKSTGLTYQFQIMESIGIPRTEVKKFAEPHHWLQHFPPICKVRRLIATSLTTVLMRLL